MNWINSFEILRYAITVVFLFDICRKKSRGELRIFVSAAFSVGTLLPAMADMRNDNGRRE